MFRFLHAADIHLDSPLKGLEEYPDAPLEQIRRAARRAGLPLVEIEEFVRKFRDIRCKMARFVRKFETKNIVSTNSRQYKQSEKLARAR